MTDAVDSKLPAEDSSSRGASVAAQHENADAREEGNVEKGGLEAGDGSAQAKKGKVKAKKSPQNKNEASKLISHANPHDAGTGAGAGDQLASTVSQTSLGSGSSAVDESSMAAASSSASGNNSFKNMSVESQLSLMQLLSKLSACDTGDLSASAAALQKEKNKVSEKKYEFWSTQPVPQFSAKVENDVNAPIEPEKEEIKPDPFTLPKSFFWDTLDIHDDAILDEVYHLLHENYVEDDDAMFRFQYPREFLRWALTPPGWLQHWHVGIRADATRKLLGFISAIPATIIVKGVSKKMSEINFLCVHKKLRAKRMAVVLIKEITRRCNEKGIFQAVYTAGTLLPRPITTCRYWHRNLNPQKLVDIGFSHMGKNMNMQRMKKLYRVAEETQIPGLRPIQRDDIPRVTVMLNDYLKQFQLCPEFDEAEVEHWFVKGAEMKVVRAYVVETVAADKTKILTDMFSFYHLPSTVVNHEKHKILHAAYSFYSVARTVSPEKLFGDALIIAKRFEFDVFNALDIMHNQEMLTNLKFGAGDGNLNYYVYNWQCAPIKPEETGLVLM